MAGACGRIGEGRRAAAAAAETRERGTSTTRVGGGVDVELPNAGCVAGGRVGLGLLGFFYGLLIGSSCSLGYSMLVGLDRMGNFSTG